MNGYEEKYQGLLKKYNDLMHITFNLLQLKEPEMKHRLQGRRSYDQVHSTFEQQFKENHLDKIPDGGLGLKDG